MSVYVPCPEGDGFAECINVFIQNELEKSAELEYDMNTFFVLVGATLVFVMQAGFAFFEVGCVQVKNQKNILVKNVFDVAIGAIAWYSAGYGIAFGSDEYVNDGSTNGFIGRDRFFLAGDAFRDLGAGSAVLGHEWADWLYQWVCATTCATVVSGAVMERVSFPCYLIYSVCLTGFIYPVVAHMTWQSGGWMSPFRDHSLLSNCGVADFGGGGVVHMTGGIVALIGAYMVGPRIGRFGPNKEVRSLPQLSWVYQAIGTLILWFGWYGFNGMSSLYIVGNGLITAKVMVNSTIAASVSCLSSTLVAYLTVGFIDPDAANNGVVSGFAAITGACGVVQPEGAVLIGFIAGLIYQGGKVLLLRLGIDDVINASPVHFFCATWGMFATGLLAVESNYGEIYSPERQHICCGAFYGCGGNLLGAQTVFILVDIAWTAVTAIAMFLVVKATVGLRVSEEVELVGMDGSKHGGMVDYIPNLLGNSSEDQVQAKKFDLSEVAL